MAGPFGRYRDRPNYTSWSKPCREYRTRLSPPFPTQTQPCGGFDSFDLYKLPTMCSGTPVEAYEQVGRKLQLFSQRLALHCSECHSMCPIMPQYLDRLLLGSVGATGGSRKRNYNLIDATQPNPTLCFFRFSLPQHVVFVNLVRREGLDRVDVLRGRLRVHPDGRGWLLCSGQNRKQKTCNRLGPRESSLKFLTVGRVHRILFGTNGERGDAYEYSVIPLRTCSNCEVSVTLNWCKCLGHEKVPLIIESRNNSCESTTLLEGFCTRVQ